MLGSRAASCYSTSMESAQRAAERFNEIMRATAPERVAFEFYTADGERVCRCDHDLGWWVGSCTITRVVSTFSLLVDGVAALVGPAEILVTGSMCMTAIDDIEISHLNSPPQRPAAQRARMRSLELQEAERAASHTEGT
jgi:hypothetical protein